MQTKESINRSETKSEKKSGAWRRFFLLCLLPIYALIGWLRLHESLNYWDYLIELNIWPRPLYFAVTGGFLGLGFTLAWVFLLLKLKTSALYNRFLGGIFLIWFWADRIWLSLREAFFNQLFTAFFITAVTLGWMFLLIHKADFKQKVKPDEP
jgi:hypothetical protein